MKRNGTLSNNNFGNKKKMRNKSTKKNEKCNPMIISLISLIISLGVFILQLYTFEYDKQKDINQNKEEINLTVSKKGYAHSILYQKFDAYSGLIPSTYEVYISNNSKQGVSILSYEINLINFDGKKISYKNIVNNEEEIDGLFPLSLEPNNTYKIIFEINNVIPESVTSLINLEYKFGNHIVYDELKNYLLEENLDIYGNRNDYFQFDGNQLVMSEPANQRFPIYMLKIETSKGNTFEKKLSFEDD
jgi:heme/copper-type cytochrome/quinol oxidase subunit 2